MTGTGRFDVSCPKPGCILHNSGAPLPVFTVDEDVYRNRPTLLIGTVEKVCPDTPQEGGQRIIRYDSRTSAGSYHSG